MVSPLLHGPALRHAPSHLSLVDGEVLEEGVRLRSAVTQRKAMRCASLKIPALNISLFPPMIHETVGKAYGRGAEQNTAWVGPFGMDAPLQEPTICSDSGRICTERGGVKTAPSRPRKPGPFPNPCPRPLHPLPCPPPPCRTPFERTSAGSAHPAAPARRDLRHCRGTGEMVPFVNRTFEWGVISHRSIFVRFEDCASRLCPFALLPSPKMEGN